MSKPNVILFIIDAARRDHFSCYGYQRPTSPFIDNLTKQSLFFKNAYSTAAWTVPSHASLFTGLYPSEHKTQNDNLYLDESIPTLAEILSANGYITVGFSDNMYVGKATGLHRGFSHFDEVWKRYRHRSRFDLFKVGLKRLLHRVDRGGAETTDLIIDWISNRAKDKPFFMFVNYIDAHQVCHPPKEFLLKFRDSKYSYWKMIKFMRGYLNGRIKFYTGKIKFSDEDWENFRWIYDVAINYVDYQISRIYEHLEGQGLLDNTILIITSDHGTNLGDHGLLHHEYCLYETLLRIPLIIKLRPSDAKKDIAQGIQLSDIFYAVLTMLSIQQETRKKEKLNIYELMEGKASDLPIFAEWRRPTGTIKMLSQAAPQFDFSKFDRGLRSIKVGSFKYIESSDGDNELYDLEADPHEDYNLYRSKPEKVKELEENLKEFVRHLMRQDEAPVYRELEADEELKERLRGLGYVT